jgi:hypothetical protein
MKKIACLLVCLPFFALANASPDSVASLPKADEEKPSPLYAELGLYSRYVWRGVSFGNAPSIQGLLSYSLGNFEVGSYGAVTLNGNKQGYGNTIEVYAKYKYKNFSLTVNDYFFFEAFDSLNSYFRYNGERTTHFVEAILKYEGKKVGLTAAYNFYTRRSDETRALYLEANYRPHPDVVLFAGYLTDASFLNFHDRGGFTNLGIRGTRRIPITDRFALPVQMSVIVNPNYRYAARVPDVSGNAINFVMAVIL